MLCSAIAPSDGYVRSSACTNPSFRPAATCSSWPVACSIGSRGPYSKSDLLLTQPDSSGEAAQPSTATLRNINRSHDRSRTPHAHHDSPLHTMHSWARPAAVCQGQRACRRRVAQLRARLPKDAFARATRYFRACVRLPVLPDLLALRRRSLARAWSTARHLARTHPPPQMHTAAPGRARPRATAAT